MVSISAVVRGAKRLPMTSKQGHNYYKGNRSGAMGWHKKGGYEIDPLRVRTFVVPPELDTCELKPYVSPKTPKWRYDMTPVKYINLVRKKDNLIQKHVKNHESNQNGQSHQS
ncbi:hypothetical protein G9A89_023245 [Geosiphon pyriformis]|nr:hypothetical protein G9A89_023245 [Geosiphon pyriformis]